MEKINYLSVDFLDILFEGKNKEYGAYELRRKSVPQRAATKIILKEKTKETVLPFTKTRTGITFTVPAVSNATIHVIE